MPKFWSVRLMMFAFALMSPTPGLPRSPSRSETGGGAYAPVRARAVTFPPMFFSFPIRVFCASLSPPCSSGNSSSCSGAAVVSVSSCATTSSRENPTIRGPAFFSRPRFHHAAILSTGMDASNIIRMALTKQAARITMDVYTSKTRASGALTALPSSPPCTGKISSMMPSPEKKSMKTPIVFLTGNNPLNALRQPALRNRARIGSR